MATWAESVLAVLWPEVLRMHWAGQAGARGSPLLCARGTEGPVWDGVLRGHSLSDPGTESLLVVAVSSPSPCPFLLTGSRQRGREGHGGGGGLEAGPV